MARVRYLAMVAVLAAGVGGCKTATSKAVAPAGDDALTVSPSEPAEPLATAPAEPMEKIQVVAALSGLEDFLAATSDVAKRLSDDPGMDPLADMQASFLQLGFAPAFLDNVDLDNQHAFAVALPATEPASPSDVEMAGTIAVVDGRKLIDAIPSGLRPQPMGAGVWEFQQQGQRVLLKEAGKELHLGLTTSDLDRAAGLRQEVGTGRRIRARAWNIPTDQVDPSSLLGLSSDLPLTRNLSKVIKEAETIELEADFGMKRDLEAMAKAKAPFSELGIEPLGKPRAVSSKVEQMLPPDPVFVATMSWGDPRLVHKMVDKGIPLDRVPSTYSDIASKAVSGAHGVLDSIADDVVVAIYMDKKGRTTLVLAATVEDDAKTIVALRSVHESIVAAAEAHAVMQGKRADAKFGVNYKPDGLKLKGTKADRLTVTVAKDYRNDLDVVATFVDKNKLDMVSMSSGKIAMLAIGSRAKSMATGFANALGRAPKSSLGGNAGLGKLREAMGGCQLCVSFDGRDHLRYLLQLLMAGKDKQVAKEAGVALGKVSKISELGDVGLGVRVSASEATVALVVPESTMFAPQQTLRLIRSTYNFLAAPSAGFQINKASLESSP